MPKEFIIPNQTASATVVRCKCKKCGNPTALWHYSDTKCLKCHEPYDASSIHMTRSLFHRVDYYLGR